MLELCRCKNCGEYLAAAMYNATTGNYAPLNSDDSDIFDIDVPDDDQSATAKLILLALSNQPNRPGDNNAIFRAEGNSLRSITSNESEDGWHIVGNTQYACPHCNAKLSRKGDESENDTDNIDSVEKFQLLKFRVSSEMISRFIAPSRI